MKDLKKAYAAPEIDIVQFKLDNVLLNNQLGSWEMTVNQGSDENLDESGNGAGS